MRKLVTRLQAQLEVEDAARWYESQQPGLRFRFLDELDSVMERITASPLQFPEIDPRIRRGLVKRFPYSVYFLVTESRYNQDRGRRGSPRLCSSDKEVSLCRTRNSGDGFVQIILITS